VNTLRVLVLFLAVLVLLTVGLLWTAQQLSTP